MSIKRKPYHEAIPVTLFYTLELLALAITQQIAPPLITERIQAQQHTIYMPTMPKTETVSFWQPQELKPSLTIRPKFTQKSHYPERRSLQKAQNNAAIFAIPSQRETERDNRTASMDDGSSMYNNRSTSNSAGSNSSIVDVMPKGFSQSFYA